MQKFLAGLLLTAVAGTAASETSLLDQDFRRLASEETVNLGDEYAGKVLLVVNTASKCGNTPQYDGLESLYQQYGDDGLVVLGFPSNDFFGQEPGTEEEIQTFCRLTYKVKFPMFEKVHVKKGTDQALLYQWLTDPALNGRRYRLVLAEALTAAHTEALAQSLTRAFSTTSASERETL